MQVCARAWGKRPSCIHKAATEAKNSLLDFTHPAVVSHMLRGLGGGGERGEGGIGHLKNVSQEHRQACPGLESIKKSSTLESSTLESSTLAISTLYLERELRDHTCAVSDVPSRVELSSFIDSSPVHSRVRSQRK